MGIDKILMGDERIEHGFKPSRYNYFNIYFFSIVLFGFGAIVYFWDIIFVSLPVALSLILIFYSEIDRLRQKYYLTNHRAITEEGILSKNWEHASYNRITDVKFSQNFTERFFGVGDLMISTAGSDEFELELEGVPDPAKFERFIAKKIEEQPMKS